MRSTSLFFMFLLTLFLASCGNEGPTSTRGTALNKAKSEKEYCELVVGSIQSNFPDFLLNDFIAQDEINKDKLISIINQYSQGINFKDWKKNIYEIREKGKTIGYGYRWAIQDTDQTRFIIEIRPKKTNEAYFIDSLKFVSALRKIDSFAFPGGPIDPSTFSSGN